uniref:Uncharacterized protein n=1 Tax=Panstrongylus lignarius TaxID=156445 RepID=A0A224Y0V6_9HEMI
MYHPFRSITIYFINTSLVLITTMYLANSLPEFVDPLILLMKIAIIFRTFHIVFSITAIVKPEFRIQLHRHHNLQFHIYLYLHNHLPQILHPVPLPQLLLVLLLLPPPQILLLLLCLLYQVYVFVNEQQ